MCILAACSQKKTEQTNRINTLRLNIPAEPPTLDPRKGGDIVSSCMQFMLFEGLTSLNPDSSTTPTQAESIDISADKTVYTFHIRRNANWSDGSPVTSYDFEKSWKDILSPSFPSPNAHLLYPIKNAEKIKKGELPLSSLGLNCPDPKTLVVTLEMPTPYFLQITAFCVLFPVHKSNDSSHPEWAQNDGPYFISNGPFKMLKWRHSDELCLEKNPHYWNNEKTQFSGVNISMIGNEMTALNMYENGDLDMVGMPFSPLPLDAVKDLANRDVLQTRPLGGSTVAFFNMNKFPFNNLNIRKGFSLALNRESIIKNITQMNETVALGMIPPVLKANRTTEFYQDQDTKNAQLCFEEGLKQLNISKEELSHLIFYYPNGEFYHKIAQAMQDQWLTTLGIRVRIEALEQKVLLDKMSKKAFDFSLFYWCAQYDDPMNIFERFKIKGNVKNYSGWENSEYQKLLIASCYEDKKDLRLDILEKAEKIIMDDMPFIPVYHWSFGFLKKDYLSDVYISPIGDIHIEKIKIDGSKKSQS